MEPSERSKKWWDANYESAPDHGDDILAMWANDQGYAEAMSEARNSNEVIDGVAKGVIAGLSNQIRDLKAEIAELRDRLPKES